MTSQAEPRVLIVGAQKGGTTSLAAALASDSRFSLPKGETPLFEDPIYATRGEATLERIRKSIPLGRIGAIKRPDWLGRPEAAARMVRHCPDALVLCALRERVQRTVSAYYWYLQTRLIPFAPLNEGLSRILDSKESGIQPPSPRALEIVDYSLYGLGVTRLLEAGFDRKKILVGHARPDGPVQFNLLDRLQRSLELEEPIEHIRGRRRNPGVYDYRRVRVLRARSRFLDHGRHGSVHQTSKVVPLLNVASKSFTAIERSLFSNVGANAPAELHPELRQRLDVHFKDDDRRLRETIGHELGVVLGNREGRTTEERYCTTQLRTKERP